MSETTATKKPSKAGMKNLFRLLPFARSYTMHFIGVIVLVLLYNSASVLQPFLVKVAIDSDIAVRHPHYSGLWMISMFYVGVVLLGVITNFSQIILLQYIGQNIIRKIRIQLFSHIEAQSMAFFDKNAVGRLVTNVSSDTETVSQFFTQFFLSLIRDGLSIVMIIFAMFELNVRIASYAMVILPIIFIISIFFRQKLRDAYQTTRTRLSAIVSFLAENLAGMRIIQIFHQEKRQANRFERLNKSHNQANVKEYGTSVMFNRVLEMLGNLAVSAIVWIGGIAVMHHSIPFGTLYAFITYIRQFFQPINAVTQQWNTLQSSMVAADRIGGVFAQIPAIQDAQSPITLDTVAGEVAFKKVTFGYQPGQTVLRDVDFVIKPGSFVGFVGATGAGKSSIMSLLMRFYEPQEGEILLDGQAITRFTQANLHRMIGLVQQEVHLFSGTVIDNIRMFREEISEETVKKAAKTVGAHEVIKKLPQGYQTMLQGKGANLSMGERQLIAFARIVALDPRVLILDEATANLDSQTERLVQTGLQAVAKNRTTLVIAHRLSTIVHADQIIVLDHGQIVERGTHATLLTLGGFYAKLHEHAGTELLLDDDAKEELKV
nr:ABC transporter ATP-binding protein [Bacilli bacterium]